MRSGDRVREFRARKVQTLLAALLIRAGQVVTTDRLITEIWGVAPPRTAMGALHVHVSKLRKELTAFGAVDPVVTRPSGYSLELGRNKLDLHDFLELVDEARLLMREGRHAEVLDRTGRASRMCAGTVVGDCCGGPMITAFSALVTATRLECVGMEAAANSALGRYGEVISLLSPVVVENPLHEPFAEQLMRALHRAHRRADALKVYDTTRAVLQAELGLEPCRYVRDLRDAILAG